MATDGSAIVWVESSSGRRFAKITAVDNVAKTVTVSDAYAVTEVGKNWGIGGKRATLASSLELGTDCRGGWTIDIQTDQTLTANFNLKPNAVTDLWTSFTSTTSTRPIISTSTNSVYGLDIQGANNLVISHLEFKSTAATPGNGIGPASTSAANYVLLSDCVIDGFAYGIRDHDNGGNVDVFGLTIANCEVKNCTTRGIYTWAGLSLKDSKVTGNLGIGVEIVATRSKGVNADNCVIDGNKGSNLKITPATGNSVVVRHCALSNCLNDGAGNGSGLYLNTTSSSTWTIEYNIIYGNYKYGVTATGGSLPALVNRRNAWGGNGTADVNGAVTTTGDNAVTLSASPFVSATDWALNDTAGAGLACQNAAALIPNASATAAIPHIGPNLKAAAAAGGRGGPLINGGLVI